MLYLFRTGVAEKVVRTAAGVWSSDGAGSFGSDRPAQHSSPAGPAIIDAADPGRTAIRPSPPACS